ncbi:MAG: YigZ family protein [Ignavibacteria bacterium]|nr:YigZ family protein [Ignavibacteria bacterium]
MSFQPYHTVSSKTESEITIKRSVFRSFLVHVTTKHDAQTFLDFLKREYWDAVHHCYAYRIGPLGMESRFSDDGEPSGTAGKPLLFALQKAKLSDVMVVVVRYYGGAKLGVGPLARAYAEAAQGAINAATPVFVEPRMLITVHCSYDDVSIITRLLEEVGAEFEATYGDAISFDVNIAEAHREFLQNEIIARTNSRAGYSKVGT